MDRVFISQGTYLTGPLQLRSHLTIEFAQGAVLLGKINRNEYPILPMADDAQKRSCSTDVFVGRRSRANVSKPDHRHRCRRRPFGRLQAILDGQAQNSRIGGSTTNK
ncbi:MAG: hypothetical protein MZU97_26420 [Bacillus subtilis]|nr:hypothetical protein [Bacillus subtilis]